MKSGHKRKKLAVWLLRLPVGEQDGDQRHPCAMAVACLCELGGIVVQCSARGGGLANVRNSADSVLNSGKVKAIVKVKEGVCASRKSDCANSTCTREVLVLARRMCRCACVGVHAWVCMCVCMCVHVCALCIIYSTSY